MAEPSFSGCFLFSRSDQVHLLVGNVRRFDFKRDAANAVRTIAVILALTVTVILIYRGTAWYMATLLGFGVVAVFATVAILIDLSSRKPKP